MNPRLLEHYKKSLDEILIDPRSEDSAVAQRFKSFFPEKIKPFKIQESPPGQLSAEDFNQSKRRVLIQPYEGEFFKQCPGGSQSTACCNYFVLNLGSQCHFNCSYCYLQSFLNTPYLVVYSNIEDAIQELNVLSESKLSFRLGTGEVIDSLGLDPITQYSARLMEALKDKDHVSLELKTKSDFVEHLLDLEDKGQTILSWSINPQEIVEKEEHGTASCEDRLKAAKKALQAGYKISFHIDPVIWHEDWKQNYKALVEDICRSFEPKDVPCVSLGALRFQPHQRTIMKQRFSRASLVNSAETFLSKDGKYRYDADLRSEMFKFIIAEFKKHHRSWKVFLCMESPETWLSTFGKMPSQVEGLEDLFSPRPHFKKSTVEQTQGER